MPTIGSSLFFEKGELSCRIQSFCDSDYPVQVIVNWLEHAKDKAIYPTIQMWDSYVGQERVLLSEYIAKCHQKLSERGYEIDLDMAEGLAFVRLAP